MLNDLIITTVFNGIKRKRARGGISPDDLIKEMEGRNIPRNEVKRALEILFNRKHILVGPKDNLFPRYN